MGISQLVIASANFTQADSFVGGIQKFVTDRSLFLSLADIQICKDRCMHWWTDLMNWLSQPHVLTVIAAWWITFTVAVTLLLMLGFGPVGIVAGSLMAAFQSYCYGGATPAGGIFATLTSMAMLGTLAFPVFILAAIIATGVAVLAWYAGWGR